MSDEDEEYEEYEGKYGMLTLQRLEGRMPSELPVSWVIFLRTDTYPDLWIGRSDEAHKHWKTW